MLSWRRFAWQIHIKTWKGCLLMLVTPRCWYTTAASDDATTPQRAGEQEDEQAMEEHQEAPKPKSAQRALIKCHSLALWQWQLSSTMPSSGSTAAMASGRSGRIFLTGRVNESLEHSLSVGSSAAIHQSASPLCESFSPTSLFSCLHSCNSSFRNGTSLCVS